MQVNAHLECFCQECSCCRALLQENESLNKCFHVSQIAATAHFTCWSIYKTVQSPADIAEELDCKFQSHAALQQSFTQASRQVQNSFQR